MTLLKPLWIQSAIGDADLTWPGAEFRQLIRALAGGDNKQGVIAPLSAVVTHRGAGANFTVDIQPFQAIVYGDDVADQGSYLITNTAVFNLTVAAGAPGSGTRTYRIVARVRDKRANAGWSTYDWTPFTWDDPGTGEHVEGPTELTLAHVAITVGQPNIQDSNITLAYPRLLSLTAVGPWQSAQSASAAWNVNNTWTDFTGGQWPALSFTVPPSGQVFVTISGTVSAIASSGGIQARIGWRCSGTDTVANDQSHSVGTFGPGSGMAGTYRTGASRRFRVTGLTPGATDTITPTWYGGSGAGDDNDGQLLIEAVL